MPLAADGVLYYTGSYSRVFALDGATGKVIWSYIPELDDALVARQTHSPYNRGAAIGEGKVYVGTVDGRLIALDMKTGKVGLGHQAAGFAEADGRVHRRAALRQGHGGHRQPGRRVAGPRPDLWRRRRDRQGEVEVPHCRRHDEAKKSWGNDSWRTGGGGGWMPGTFEAETNTVYWGTANPAPLYDWSGAEWKTRARAPATTSTPVGDRPRHRYRQPEILPSGTAARRLGLRQRGRRVRDAGPRRQTIHRASRTRAASSSSMTAT